VQRISVAFGISECWRDQLVAGAAKKVHARLDENFERGNLATSSVDGMCIGCWSAERGSIAFSQQRLFNPLAGETGQRVS
jgi:hypothetical protein